MSKALSLKMEEAIFRETEHLLKKIRMPRNAYINHAIAFYNRLQKRRLTRRGLRRDVALLRGDTEEIIRDMELLEDLDL